MAFLIQVLLFITFTHLIVGSGETHCWSKANPLVGKDRCVRDTTVIGSMIDCHIQIHNGTRTRNWIAWNDRSIVVYFQEWNGHGSSKAFIHNKSFEKWILQFDISRSEMRIMIRIQNYIKHHCNGKVIQKSENETTLLLFYHRLQGTAHSQQRNRPQEQPHCTKGNNMIYSLILTIFPFSKDILNYHIHIGHWEMISARYWILTILNEPSHRFTSRPSFTLMNSSTIVLRGAELKASIHQSKIPTYE